MNIKNASFIIKIILLFQKRKEFRQIVQTYNGYITIIHHYKLLHKTIYTYDSYHTIIINKEVTNAKNK